MTPQEKAKDLLAKMLYNTPNVQDGYTEVDYIIAKKSAIVCVNEILKEIPTEMLDTDKSCETLFINKSNDRYDYYLEVKTEIEKL
jgi:hypothetical protein